MLGIVCRDCIRSMLAAKDERYLQYREDVGGRTVATSKIRTTFQSVDIFEYKILEQCISNKFKNNGFPLPARLGIRSLNRTNSSNQTLLTVGFRTEPAGSRAPIGIRQIILEAREWETKKLGDGGRRLGEWKKVDRGPLAWTMVKGLEQSLFGGSKMDVAFLVALFCFY